jgi:hypothetical protein
VQLREVLVNPEQQMPPQAKRKSSCWSVASVGCLVLIVVLAFLWGSAYLIIAHSPGGRQALHQVSAEINKALASAQLVPSTELEMDDIRGAVLRFHIKTGKYPASLNELSPDYLANKSELHSKLDTVSDTNHISFVYTRPAVTSLPSAVILSMSWQLSMDIQNKPQVTKFVLTETLGGQQEVTQYMNGKETVKQSVASLSN